MREELFQKFLEDYFGHSDFKITLFNRVALRARI